MGYSDGGYTAFIPPVFKPRQFVCLGKATNSADAESDITYDWGMSRVNTGNGGKYYFYTVCDGTETKLDLSYYKNAANGIFDVYLNNTLDTSGVDFYAAGDASAGLTITLTVKPISGLNTVKLVCNGKNAGSSSYAMTIRGVVMR
jgi:hypothetical protein